MAQAHPHSRTRMGGRDPHQAHRAATPLELLFDLTFVVAFGIGGDELAHFLAEGHVAAGLRRLRVRDVRHLVGVDQVLLVRLGLRHRRLDLPAVDDGADGRRADPRPRPAGHVRVDRPRRDGGQHGHGRRLHRHAGARMVFQWLRAARQDPGRRSACLTYAVAILVAQAGWVALLIAQTSVAGHVRLGRRPRAGRAGRPGDRRDPQGRHPVARPPHRRAVRAAGDHHAGRGMLGTTVALKAR